MRLAGERESLMDEQEKALVEALRQKGINVPDDELLQIKPQVSRLKARGLAKGSVSREADLRVEEVNQLLRNEPPRRTVTGSFRVH